jgi:hypothetical protein
VGRSFSRVLFISKSKKSKSSRSPTKQHSPQILFPDSCEIVKTQKLKKTRSAIQTVVFGNSSFDWKAIIRR